MHETVKSTKPKRSVADSFYEGVTSPPFIHLPLRPRGTLQGPEHRIPSASGLPGSTGELACRRAAEEAERAPAGAPESPAGAHLPSPEERRLEGEAF